MKRSMWELLKIYPTMRQPVDCENGCGAVIELMESFRSYRKDSNGEPLLICSCCAAEEGHREEDDEEPEESPRCERPRKTKIR